MSSTPPTPRQPTAQHQPYSLLLSGSSCASRFDAKEQSSRTRLNHRRRAVYVVGVFSIDVDDGITTVVIRTARANASPVTSSRDRHCTAVRNATRAATGIAKIRLAKAIHIPRRRSTYVRCVRTSVEPSLRHGCQEPVPSKRPATGIVQKDRFGGATRVTFWHLAQARFTAALRPCSLPPSGRFSASRFNAEKRANR